ncbi:MAG: hypothetical protein FRX49_08586 [Trebouxia sp. A1-2]|nr:MAG: hypothetical protein FRX49_08586 [Trebouxia sp. A1-2]
MTPVIAETALGLVPTFSSSYFLSSSLKILSLRPLLAMSLGRMLSLLRSSFRASSILALSADSSSISARALRRLATTIAGSSSPTLTIGAYTQQSSVTRPWKNHGCVKGVPGKKGRGFLVSSRLFKDAFLGLSQAQPL